MSKRGRLESGAFGSNRRLPTLREGKKAKQRRSSSRRMPTQKEIEEEAIRLYMLEGHDISTNLPERKELSEGGFLKEAQHRLMSSRSEGTGVIQSQAKAEQRQYVDTMADEMNLKVIPKRELKELRKKTGIQHVNGWDIPEPKPKPKKKVVEAKRITRVTPKPKKVKAKPKKKPKRKAAKPKPKKRRKRLRVARARKVTRRFGDGEIISFPDDVWKVRGKR